MLPDVIILNGASSSGKTSIAQALQEALPCLFLYFGIDAVLYSLPPTDLLRMIAGERIDRRGYEYDKLIRGHHRAASGLLAAGNKLILDNALTKAVWMADLQAQLRGFRTFWVGVSCESQVLAERELKRGDRAVGTAQREALEVHEGWHYDAFVDTTSCTPQKAAALVLAALGHCAS